jgi:succinate dehydrogenase flavin-adding protein (antitoxin of CptAB toxin-antitoxin module)
MRELDELLIRYLEVRYPNADEDEKAAFQAVLELPDPDLNGYLLQRQTPPTKSIAGVIEHILSHPQS